MSYQQDQFSSGYSTVDVSQDSTLRTESSSDGPGYGGGAVEGQGLGACVCWICVLLGLFQN